MAIRLSYSYLERDIMIPPELRRELLMLQRIGMKSTDIKERLGICWETVTNSKRKFTRLVVLADLHCGHRAGLTHPDWQWHIEKDFNKKFAIQQKEMWDWFQNRIETLQPIDRLVINGDAVEGKGPRSGGTELITLDRNEQVEMAAAVIRECHAPKIIMTKGTPAHTGTDEDWEDVLAAKLKENALVEIGDQAWPKINGIQFNFKHKGTSSTVPHGSMTPLAKNYLWNQVWNSDDDKQPRADIIVRSHTHRFGYCGEKYLAVSTPALQGWGSKFGQRQCEGKVDFGLIWFDVPNYAMGIDDVKFEKDLPALPSQKVVPKDW